MYESQDSIFYKMQLQLMPFVRENYSLLKKKCDLEKLQIVVFGAGTYGKYVYEQICECGLGDYVYSFCDNNEVKWGSDLCGKKIFSLTKLIEENERYIFVIASAWCGEIRKQLLDNKQIIFDNSKNTVLMEKIAIRKDLIFKECPCGSIPYFTFKARELYSKDENKIKINTVREMIEDEVSKKILDLRLKFINDIDMSALGKMYELSEKLSERQMLPMTDKEVFVDCGAFTGDSISHFLKETDGKYKKIYA